MYITTVCVILGAMGSKELQKKQKTLTILSDEGLYISSLCGSSKLPGIEKRRVST